MRSSTLNDIINDHSRYRKQLGKLALSNLRKTYKGSALGWAWAGVKPAISIAMYYFAFVVGLRIGRPVNGYSYFLWFISGMAPWFYISDVYIGGATSIRRNSFLVTKIRFPFSTIPTFVSLSFLVVNGIVILLVLFIFFASGYSPDVYWLQIPLYFLLMFLFFTAWALFAGVVSCVSSDFMQLVRSSTMVLLWTSTVFFRAERIENGVIRFLVKNGPVSILTEGFRDALINKVWFWEKPITMLCLLAEYLILAWLAVHYYKKLKEDIPDII